MILNDFYMIAAHDKERGIGKDNNLPWRLSADLKMFSEVTSNTNSRARRNVVIMGRRTWDSLPDKFRPLPNRINVVLSTKELDLPEGVIQAKTFEDALQVSGETIFVIGGSTVYSFGINHPNCRGLYITKIDKEFECDTYFPEYESLYEPAFMVNKGEENGLSFEINYLRKKQNA